MPLAGGKVVDYWMCRNLKQFCILIKPAIFRFGFRSIRPRFCELKSSSVIIHRITHRIIVFLTNESLRIQHGFARRHHSGLPRKAFSYRLHFDLQCLSLLRPFLSSTVLLKFISSHTIIKSYHIIIESSFKEILPTKSHFNRHHRSSANFVDFAREESESHKMLRSSRSTWFLVVRSFWKLKFSIEISGNHTQSHANLIYTRRSADW